MEVFDFIFPRKCLECIRVGSYICRSCIDSVSFLAQICPSCGRFSRGGRTHKHCKKEHTLDGLYSVWAYKGIVRKALIRTKYQFSYKIIKELSNYALESINKGFLRKKNAILIPIPVGRNRKNWRGFNQTSLIAKEISKKMKWEVKDNILVKRGKNPPQTGLSKIQRFENIKDTFSVKGQVNMDENTNFIIDDIWTTGSTMKEAATTLKRNGIDSVWGFTLAR